MKRHYKTSYTENSKSSKISLSDQPKVLCGRGCLSLCHQPECDNYRAAQAAIVAADRLRNIIGSQALARLKTEFQPSAFGNAILLLSKIEHD